MLSLLLVLCFILNISLGSVFIPIKKVAFILIGDQNIKESWQYIVLNYRMPKAIVAVLVGGGLGVSGLLMQTLFRNPLAGPYVLGLSSGASLGVAIVILGASLFGGAFAELTNGDPFTNPSWPMNVVYTMTTASPIAVYDSIGSGNATLSFEEFGARFNDLQEVQVSTDGINFTTVADNLSYAVLSQSGGSSYPNPALRTVNIAPYIASNPNSVWIRFSWTTNFPNSATNPNVWVAYGWMIDDVQLSETPANSISLIEENND